MHARRVLAMFLAISAGPALARAADESGRDRRRTPIVEVYERCHDAVVNLSTTRRVQVQSLGGRSIIGDIFDFGPPRAREREINSVGSGVVVHSSGYIVTNAHVVAQASDVRVTFADQRELVAEIVAVDSEHDLAVVKVQSPRPLAAIKLGRSDDLMIGETVVAIGNPLGLQNSVTSGIISALDRKLVFSDELVYTGLIQTDAAINPGNSGGPLINLNGELIGINSAIRGDAQNLGFAIPVDRLWQLLPMLLDVERRERVTFGLTVAGSDITVASVRPGTPAADAGLQTGDRIVRFDGEPLANSIDYFVHLLDRKPGDEVALTVKRADQTIVKKVPLEPAPPPDGAKLAKQLLGMDLLELTAAQRRQYQLPEYVGLIVESVDRLGPAARAGIMRGDAILRVNRSATTTLEQAGLALENVQSGEPLLVQGLRLTYDPPFFWDTRVVPRGRM